LADNKCVVFINMPNNKALNRVLDDGRPFYAHVAMACMEGNCDRLQALIDSLLKADDVKDLLFMNQWPDEMTLLKMAAAQGHLNVVQFLLEKGADPNDNGSDPDKSYQGDDDPACFAPIHLAALAGHFDCLKFLMEQDDIESYIMDRNHCTVFHHACIQGNLLMVQYLFESSDMTKSPYSKTLFLNHRDGTGATGLSWAARKGHVEVVQYLLEQGADKDLVDTEEKKTPLQYAATPAIAKMLQ